MHREKIQQKGLIVRGRVLYDNNAQGRTRITLKPEIIRRYPVLRSTNDVEYIMEYYENCKNAVDRVLMSGEVPVLLFFTVRDMKNGIKHQ